MKKRLFAGILAGILMLSCAGCSGSSSSPAASGSSSSETSSSGSASLTAGGSASSRDTLHVATTTDPEGLDPQKTSAVSTFFVTTNIFEPLLIVDENWNYQPRLAESWEVADDFKSVTFHLKKGVLFHNRREMKAQDVKYSIERLHEDDSSKKKYYKNITGAEIIDDYTIRFTTDEPDPVLLTSFAYPWSVIIPEECADDLKTHPIGTGPYMFSFWTFQQSLELTAFEAYHDTPASIKTIDYEIVPDLTTAMVGLLSGEIDLVDVTGASTEPIENNDAVSLFVNPVNSVTSLCLNLDNEYLSNELVREAMACAIDKDIIIKNCSFGYGDKVGSYLPSAAAEYIDTNDAHPYDPEHAKELLAQAGYADGITLKLTLPKAYPVYANIGQMISDQLSKVGITCQIEMVEWADWMQNVYTDKNYDMTVMANTGRLSAYDFIARFKSDSGDYISCKTGECDEILTALETELDATRRTELIQDFQKLVAEKVPVIPIETQYRIFAMNSALKGFTMYPSETTEFKILKFEQ